MLQEMGEQQQAVFRMAFKMHNTTNYVIVSPGSDEKPDLVLVDTDTPEGVEAWKESKKTYPEVPVAMFSSELPTVTTPYLDKPLFGLNRRMVAFLAPSEFDCPLFSSAACCSDGSKTFPP